MSNHVAGGFECRGRGFRFQEAHCDWEPGGELFIEASGERCALRLVGVPFPGAMELDELPGRFWEPNAAERAIYADTFAEGGLEVRGKPLWIMAGRIECRRYEADRGILVLSVRLDVQDGEYGREDEADGMVYCLVRSRKGFTP